MSQTLAISHGYAGTSPRLSLESQPIPRQLPHANPAPAPSVCGRSIGQSGARGQQGHNGRVVVPLIFRHGAAEAAFIAAVAA
jgi:hypothetical protein